MYLDLRMFFFAVYYHKIYFILNIVFFFIGLFSDVMCKTQYILYT